MTKQSQHKSAAMLIASVAMFANVSFAQTQPPNPAQEVVDFMSSPQGSGVVHKVQILLSASLGKIGISNELERVAGDITLDLPVRQFAQSALLTYDSSATNTYDEIVAFCTTWPFREETPPLITIDTITVMKRGLEIGSSGFAQLNNTLSDTNYPVLYREQVSRIITNYVHHLTH